MMNPDGSLRQRTVTNPVSQPGVYQEESILRRRAKMAQEDREPVSIWVFPIITIVLSLCLAAGWYFIIRHDDHWIIDEIDMGHVEVVENYLTEHHEFGVVNQMDNVRLFSLWPRGAVLLLRVPPFRLSYSVDRFVS